MKLGEILVKSGMITPEVLESALASQPIHGERLGSCLVESGMLSSDQISQALAYQFGIPPALEADFARSDPELRRRLNAHQATKLNSIPLFYTGNRRVAVAMSDPLDSEILEELSFIMGATIEPMVAADQVIAKQLERLYSMPQRRRTTGFQLPQSGPPALESYGTQRIPSSRSQTQIEIQPFATDVDSWSREFARPEDLEVEPQIRDAVRRRAPTIRLAPLKLGASESHAAIPTTLMDDSVCYTPTPIRLSQPALHRTPVPPSQVPQHRKTLAVPTIGPGRDLAVELILSAKDRQTASDNLFSFMRTNFEVGAMFAVNGQFAEGRFGYVRENLCKAVESVVFSLSLPSCFRIARSRHCMFKGPTPPDGLAVHKLLWSALAVPPPTEVLVCPVKVDQQITVLLYAQGKNGGHIDSVVAGRMEQVCAALGDSLLRLAG